MRTIAGDLLISPQMTKRPLFCGLNGFSWMSALAYSPVGPEDLSGEAMALTCFCTIGCIGSIFSLVSMLCSFLTIAFWFQDSE